MAIALKLNKLNDLNYTELYEIDGGGFWQDVALVTGTVLVAAAFVMCTAGLAGLAVGATTVVMSASTTVTTVGMVCAGVEMGLTGVGLIACY